MNDEPGEALPSGRLPEHVIGYISPGIFIPPVTAFMSAAI